MNNVGIMLWGSALEFDIKNLTCEKVNDLTDLFWRDYNANPIHMNSLGIMLWGTLLEFDISKV